MKKLISFVIGSVLLVPLAVGATGTTCPSGQHLVPGGFQLVNGHFQFVPQHCEANPVPEDFCTNIAGFQAQVPEGKIRVNGECIDVVPPPLTCDTGFHVVNEACVPDEVTPPEEPPTCTESQHLANNVCVDNEVTPPPTETTPPSSSSSTESDNGGNGGGQGGHRHCDVPGTPSCVDYFGGITGGATGATDVRPQLIGLLQQLVNLLRLKLLLMPHDFKG